MECSLSLTCTREIIDPINRIQKHILFDFSFIIFQSTTMCLPSFCVNYILYLWLLPLTWWCLYPSGPNFWSHHKVISITQTHREYIFSFYYMCIYYICIYNLDCVAKYYWNLSPTPFSLLPLFFFYILDKAPHALILLPQFPKYFDCEHALSCSTFPSLEATHYNNDRQPRPLSLECIYSSYWLFLLWSTPCGFACFLLLR